MRALRYIQFGHARQGPRTLSLTTHDSIALANTKKRTRDATFPTIWTNADGTMDALKAYKRGLL